MDTNEITCPKCGHLNNYISEGCVKCGIIFSKYFEMQVRQKESVTAEATIEPNTGNETPIPMSIETLETVEPEPAPDDDKIQTTADKPVIEPQESANAEVKPAEDPSQAVAEISVEEIEMPIDAIVEPPESDKSIRPETPQAGNEEADIAQPPEKKAGSGSTPTAAPVDSKQQTVDQSPLQEKAEQVTQETAGEPSPEPEKTAAAPAAEEVLELVETVESETEAKPEEIQPKIEPQTVALKDSESAKTGVVSTPNEDKGKPETSEEKTLMEAEEEILLEEAAKPAKTEATPVKSEDNTRAELLKKQKAALAKAEALKKEKEIQAKAAALKKQKLAQAKLEALKKQKAAQAKLEALKKQKAELAKAEALKKQKAKTGALKQQKDAQAQAEASAQDTQATATAGVDQQRIGLQAVEPKIKIMGLLKKYQGKTIGINYDNSADIREAELVEANDEFFSVLVKDTKLQYSYPLQTLLSLVEGENGVETGEAENKTKYDAVIKVYPLVLF